MGSASEVQGEPARARTAMCGCQRPVAGSGRSVPLKVATFAKLDDDEPELRCLQQPQARRCDDQRAGLCGGEEATPRRSERAVAASRPALMIRIRLCTRGRSSGELSMKHSVTTNA